LHMLEIPWREDASNRDPAYTRNWLRMEIIPRLEERIPQDIHAAAGRTRDLMEECLQIMDRDLAAFGVDLSPSKVLETGILAGQEAGLIRRAFQAWWMRHHAEVVLPKSITDQVVRIVASKPRDEVAISLPGSPPDVPGKVEWRLVIDGRRTVLQIVESAAPVPDWPAICWMWSAGPLFLPDGGILAGRTVTWGDGDYPYTRANPDLEAWLAYPEESLVVRQWKPGDSYQPLGAPGRRKLQDLFVDAGVKVPRRHQLPVLTDRQGLILWVPGFPPAEAFKVCQNDNSALQLTYLAHSSAFRQNHAG